MTGEGPGGQSPRRPALGQQWLPTADRILPGPQRDFISLGINVKCSEKLTWVSLFSLEYYNLQYSLVLQQNCQLHFYMIMYYSKSFRVSEKLGRNTSTIQPKNGARDGAARHTAPAGTEQFTAGGFAVCGKGKNRHGVPVYGQGGKALNRSPSSDLDKSHS